MNNSRTIGAVRTFQNYVLNPSEDNFRLAADLLDDCRLTTQKQTRRPYKTFAPLLVDQPFDSKPLLTILANSSAFKATTLFQQKSTTGRVELLAQSAKITGNSFEPHHLRDVMDGTMLTSNRRLHWASAFYKSDGVGLLIQTYVGQSRLALPDHDPLPLFLIALHSS